MDARKENEAAMNPTSAERKSDRELAITRTFDAPPRIVFEAWTKAELFKLWWVPKSFPIVLLSCEMDVRVGGEYRLVFDAGNGQPMAFFGTYSEVSPPSRLVWTNDEGGEAGAVTTVTFEEKDGKTHLVMTDRFPTKDALDAAIASGSTSGNHETFDQLAEFLATRRAS